MRPQINYGMTDYADYLRDESIIAGLRHEAKELHEAERSAFNCAKDEGCPEDLGWPDWSYWDERDLIIERLREVRRELRFLAA